MEINPFNLFFHPKKSVKKAVENPNFSKAFFIVLLPSVILLLSFFIVGLEIEILSFVAYSLKNYLMWLVVAASLYFFVFLAKGKEMKGKFAAIYSAVSITWLFISIMLIIFIIASVAFSPKLFGLIRVIENESLGPVEGTALMKIMAENDLQGMQDFRERNNIKSDLAPLLLPEGETLYNEQAMAGAVILSAIIVFYALGLYPFLAIKQVTGLNSAATFILYVFSMGLVLGIATLGSFA